MFLRYFGGQQGQARRLLHRRGIGGNGVKFCLVHVMSLAPPCRSGDRCGWAGSYDVSSGEGCPGLGNLEG